MRWTVRLEVRTSAGKVKTTDLATFSRAVVVSTLAEVGLVLADAQALLARLGVRHRTGAGFTLTEQSMNITRRHPVVLVPSSAAT